MQGAFHVFWLHLDESGPIWFRKKLTVKMPSIISLQSLQTPMSVYWGFYVSNSQSSSKSHQGYILLVNCISLRLFNFIDGMTRPNENCAADINPVQYVDIGVTAGKVNLDKIMRFFEVSYRESNGTKSHFMILFSNMHILADIRQMV